MSRLYISKEIRDLVFERADFKCEYCFSLDQYSSSTFAIEHIIPISKKGTNEVTNLALSCHGCNKHKYNKMFGFDIETGLLAPLYNPRNDDWKSHFVWNKDYTLIIGLTSIGRATIDTLLLNRFRLINQRQVFIDAGLHPPKFTL
jgi:hypothetical protein